MKRKFQDALRGVILGLKDHSIRLQWIMAAMTVCAGFVLKLTYMEWVTVILCIAAVIITETMNTAAEKICDLHGRGYSEQIRTIKDLSAGAVLLAAFGALVCAVIILVRHIGG